MPVKITPDDAYDEESDTLRVGRHDLERRLLEFRALVAKHEPGSWSHMKDYDLSFERLADAVDAATAARRGARWDGPDLRMRCTTTEVAYTWPTGAPYDGGTPVVWNVPGYGSHATSSDPRRPRPKSLCSFSWSMQEACVVDGPPDFRECLREGQLGAERPCGNW
ncbi:hypothetical protein ACWCV9_36655 [Streptomyces sp. NPDC001606]